MYNTDNLDDLRTLRQRKGLTIESLASGMMRTATLSEVENGHRLPRKSTRRRLESIIGPVDWRKTLAAGDREHLIYFLSEFVNEDEPGAVERIRFARKSLLLIEETLTI